MKKRHEGRDGTLEGYTLADGSYVGIQVGREGETEGRRGGSSSLFFME